MCIHCRWLSAYPRDCCTSSQQKPHTPCSNQPFSTSNKARRHLRAGNGSRTTTISLLGDGQLHTLALWQRDPWLLSTDDEDVVLTGSERVVYGILNVDNVESSVVTLTVSDDTNATHVTTTSSHGDDSGIKLDELGDLASGEVDLDGVVNLDGWVWVTDTTHKQNFVSISVDGGIATVETASINRFDVFFDEDRPKLGPTAE